MDSDLHAPERGDASHRGGPLIHRLHSTQVIRASIERAWDFFSDPRNLSKITPPELDFTILGTLPKPVHPGMMIEYRVRPLLGIPVRWLERVMHFDEGWN